MIKVENATFVKPDVSMADLPSAAATKFAEK